MKNFDKIDRYLNGGMPDAERQSFEQEIAQNPALAEEIQLQEFEDDTINLMIEDDLLTKIKQIGTENETVVQLAPKKSKSIFRLRWVQIAAAASVLLFTVFSIYNLSNSQTTPTELAMLSYDQNSPNFSSVRSTEGGDQKEYDKYSAYISDKEKGLMPETIRFFREQKNVDALYKIGHAYLLNNDFTLAAESFSKYLSSAQKTKRDYKNASFYLALAYLGNNDTSAAKSILNEIKETPNHIFQKDAMDVLKKLNKMD